MLVRYLQFLCILAGTLLIAGDSTEIPDVTTPSISNSGDDTNSSNGDVLGHITTLCLDGRFRTTIEPTEFEPFPNVETLEISPGLGELQPYAFASLKMLTNLTLDNNLIRSLPVGAFSGLHKLKILSIHNNQLESLSDGDEFVGLVQLESLSLGSNSINLIHPGTFTRLGELKLLNLSWNRLTSFEGINLPSANQLEVLDISYNYVKRLNVSFFHSLQALAELSLAGNLFESLHPNTFATLRNLTRLDLSDNFLPSLPVRLFTSNRKLVELNLANNLLITVPANLFGGLKSLEILNLRNNRLTKLPEGKFNDQPVFTQLVLEGNRIDRFQPMLLKSSDVLLANNRLRGLAKPSAANGTLVQRLYLYGNEIASIEQDVFEPLPKLETLYLDYNRISELSPMLFHTNHQLQHVTLSHNRLAMLRTNTFAGLARLHSVDLSHNELVAIEEFAFHGSPVEYLNLNDNRLQTLDDWAYSGTNLLYLYVDSNAIGTLRQESRGTSVLDGLMELSVANNRIDQWQEFCARNFSRLSTVNLANNSLPPLEGDGCRSRLARSVSVTIDVTLNKVSEIPEFAGRIRLLDLSDNAVEDLRNGQRFARYEQTEVLLLRNSSLRGLSSVDFIFLPHLKELAVGSRYLESIEGDTLHQLRLQRLEITNSPLKTLPDALLKSQSSLSCVSFAKNKLASLSPTFFANCPLLEEIDLAANDLQVADRAWFQELEHLKSINLEGNRITQLPSQLLSTDTHSLELLSLAGNALSTIAGASFLADVSIKTLNLSNNHLQDVAILQQNDFITQLDVTGNRLKELMIHPSYSLLVANGNLITTLAWDSHYYLKYTSLEMLYLSDNLLERLDQRLFEMPTLVQLDVSENRLDRFPFDQLHRLKRLSILNVSRNNIRTLPTSGVERFKLYRLDLTENPLENVPDAFLRLGVVNDLIVHTDG